MFDIGRRALDDWTNTCSVEGEDVVTASKRWRRRGAGVYERPKDVLRDGDIAMYQAKSAGRSGFVTFSAVVADAASGSWRRQARRRAALRRSQPSDELGEIYRKACGRMGDDLARAEDGSVLVAPLRRQGAAVSRDRLLW